ncbi:MAG: hypothetical protein KIT78_09520 [Steroidobacteraceae bacterium]|nr:hypothetical protein [Steroidobacteraceae bacterium]
MPDSRIEALIAEFEASLERHLGGRIDAASAADVFYGINAAMIAATPPIAAAGGIGTGRPPRPKYPLTLWNLVGSQLGLDGPGGR